MTEEDATSRTRKELRCPICKTIVDVGADNAPFCSDRCRVVDLGKWASGEYRISSPILDPDVLEDLDRAAMRRRSEDE